MATQRPKARIINYNGVYQLDGEYWNITLVGRIEEVYNQKERIWNIKDDKLMLWKHSNDNQHDNPYLKNSEYWQCETKQKKTTKTNRCK